MKKFQFKYLNYEKKGTETEAVFEQRFMNEINYWANVGWYVVSHVMGEWASVEKHYFVLGFEVVDETPIPTSAA